MPTSSHSISDVKPALHCQSHRRRRYHLLDADGLTPSIGILVGDLQHLAASLAMHGIGIVSQQPAIWAFEAHLVWPQHGASEIEKQSYAKNHDNDRYQPAGGALQCDVAETRSGQCGDG